MVRCRQGNRRLGAVAGAKALVPPARSRPATRRYPRGVLLDKPRRNAIFEALVSAGHDPRDFEILGETITHRTSDNDLTVGRAGHERFIVTYVVGDSNRVEQLGLAWDQVVESVVGWVDKINDDASTRTFGRSLEPRQMSSHLCPDLMWGTRRSRPTSSKWCLSS